MFSLFPCLLLPLLALVELFFLLCLLNEEHGDDEP